MSVTEPMECDTLRAHIVAGRGGAAALEASTQNDVFEQLLIESPRLAIRNAFDVALANKR